MTWIRIADKLPEEGKYVLGRHNRRTWHDSDDQENVNCVVVKLTKGISMKEREQMKKGEIPMEYAMVYNKGVGERLERWHIYKVGDEWNNNTVSYSWETFGPGSFFGQEITHWMPIPSLD